MEDLASAASTHLNICAIYSHLGKHQEAADHAELAVEMLGRVKAEGRESEGEKSFGNVLMLSHYNLGVEL